MKRIIFILALFISLPAFAQPWGPKGMTDTDVTAAAAIVGPNDTADEVLPNGSYTIIDIVNGTNCDVALMLDDLTGTPKTYVPAGTSETIDIGAASGYIGSSASLSYFLTGTSCSTGSVYVKAIK